MAAELLAGAALGAVVSELLRGMLRVLKDLKNKDKNVQELERHLHRLEPCVEELRSILQRQTAHSARVWLRDLEGELKAASELVTSMSNTSMGAYLHPRTARRLVLVNVRISNLMLDAVVANWASTLSTIENLTQRRIEDRTVLDDIKTTQERNWGKQEQVWDNQEQVWERQKQIWKEEETFRLQMSRAITFEPSHLREREIRRASGYASSSSADRLEHYQSITSDTSKPKVEFGGNLVAEDLIATLIDEQVYTKWIGLWAMGGAGKTFTARKVYNDPRIQQYFSGGQFWITVSKDGMSARFLLQNLFEEVQGSSISSQLPDILEERKVAVKNLLTRDKVLLVMDDIWNSEISESLDVISEERKGVILVTTRDDKILRRQRAKIIEIPRLSPDHSWQLFSWHAFHDHERRNLPPRLESIAKDVAAECQGLPLALEVIGASMKSLHVYSMEKRGKNLADEWKEALERLRGANLWENEYENLFGRLQLSLESLCEIDARLQDCFFDFATFPEDQEITIGELVNMWTAGGSVKADADSNFSSRDEANYLVGLLVAKSMVELAHKHVVAYFGEEVSCKVHDVMRDLARRNLKINFKTKQKIDVHERKCLYAPGLGLKEFPDMWSSTRTKFLVEQLSLFRNNLRELPDNFDAPNLRILILQKNRDLTVLPPGFFRTLSNLRVLNLAQTGIKTISDDVVLSLKSLVLLDVRNCVQLTTISRRIEDLDNLETLLAGWTFTIYGELPFLELAPLHGEVPNSFPTFFPELKPPRSLRTLSGTFGDEVCKWGSLRNLDINSRSHLSGLSSLAGLEMLKLRTTHVFPAQVLQLCQLKILKVYLDNDANSDSEADDVAKYEVPCLGELPQLEVLELEIGEGEVHFPPSFASRGAFPCLKEMKLGIENTAWFTFHPETMPRIETLAICGWSRRNSHRETHESLRELTNLESLSLKIFDDETLEFIFREPGCFPNLENVTLDMVNLDTGKTSRKLPLGIGALPRLRYMELSTALSDLCLRGGDYCEGYDCPEEFCPHVKPPRLLERENQGQLEVIVRNRYAEVCEERELQRVNLKLFQLLSSS